MLKTVKGKVIAGTVAVTLLAGTGAAFGSSFNAGDKLLNWYNKQFLASSGEMAADVKNDVEGKIKGLATEYEGLKIDAKEKIDQRKSDESEAKSASIDAEAQAHIDAINTKEAKISGYMDDQFDTLLGTANALIFAAGLTATDYANKDLKNYTGETGKAALNDLTTELTDATDVASKELSDEILATKTALLAQLKEEKDATTAEIKKAIDDKISALRTSITKKKDDLVVAQQALITAKAVALETAAKQSLQGIVDDI